MRHPDKETPVGTNVRIIASGEVDPIVHNHPKANCCCLAAGVHAVRAIDYRELEIVEEPCPQ